MREFLYYILLFTCSTNPLNKRAPRERKPPQRQLNLTQREPDYQQILISSCWSLAAPVLKNFNKICIRQQLQLSELSCYRERERKRECETDRQTDRRRVEHNLLGGGNNFGCTSYFAAFTFTCSLQDKKQTGRLSSAIRLSALLSNRITTAKSQKILQLQYSHTNTQHCKQRIRSTERERGGGE